jgi:hypothetical protein
MATHRDPARQRQTGTHASTGRFTRGAIAERRQIQAVLGETRKLLEEIAFCNQGANKKAISE